MSMSKATELFEQYISLRLQGQSEDEAQRNLTYGIQSLPVGNQVSLMQRFMAWESERTINDFDIAERMKLSNITMKIIFCPNCDSPNVVGVSRCQVCDAKLDTSDVNEVETVYAEAETTQVEESSPAIVLYSLKSSRQFALRPQLNKTGLRLGRASQSTPVEVDLTEVGASDLGVSRTHALLQYDNGNEGIYITDLSSTNGTFVNGVRLPANARTRLRDGDELQLGHLKHLKLGVRFNEVGT
jgi:hypothetical protein